MNIGTFEQMEIKKHFNLDQGIKDLEDRANELRKMFYDRTLSSHIVSTDIEVITLGFNIEKNVANLVDSINTIEKRIERQSKRKHFFDRYIDSLKADERIYLMNRYSKRRLPNDVDLLDKKVYEEILEIDDAINFMYGYPVEIKQEDIERNSKTVNDRVNFMAEALGV